MPYYDDLKPEFDEVLCWADLRHEQSADIEPLLQHLRETIQAIRRQLVETPSSPSQCHTEPNALAAIQNARPSGPRRLWDSFDPDRNVGPRLTGAWLGRAAGCTLGAPVELWSIEEMEELATRSGDSFPPRDYWSEHPFPTRLRYTTSPNTDYLRDHVSGIPVDDDLAYTLLGLLILEKYGPAFTTEDVAQAWLAWLPFACTAEDIALKSLQRGVSAAFVGERDNPYQEWIGAAIRADAWGYAAPGWPEKAAEMAYHDAFLSHRGNGIYGAMFWAAAIAAAFAVSTPEEAIQIGLTEIPHDCRLAKAVQWALTVAPSLTDWRAARMAVDQQFPGMHPVHTINNACLTVFGLLLGKGDFTATIGMTVAMGRDNDCTAATAGSLLGALLGIDHIPNPWHERFNNRAQSYLIGHETFANDDIADRFLRVARKVYGEG